MLQSFLTVPNNTCFPVRCLPCKKNKTLTSNTLLFITILYYTRLLAQARPIHLTLTLPTLVLPHVPKSASQFSLPIPKSPAVFTAFPIPFRCELPCPCHPHCSLPDALPVEVILVTWSTPIRSASEVCSHATVGNRHSKEYVR